MALDILSLITTNFILITNRCITLILISNFPTLVMTTFLVFFFLIFIRITVPRMKLETLSHIAWISGLAVIGGFFVAQLIIFYFF